MEEIKKDGKLLAVVWRDSDWSDGLAFPTPDDFTLQVGNWQYPEGKKLAAHRHIENVRSVSQTHEMVFVKSGRLKVSVFDSNNDLVTAVDLEAGDYAVMGDCGHGYEILEDKTQVLEAKTGPFVGVEADKVSIE